MPSQSDADPARCRSSAIPLQNDAPLDALMTDYLLGGLSPDRREQVEQRLSASAEWFGAMAAIEDDLIRQWHRGTMSPGLRPRFSAAYGSTEARRRRVDAEARLMAAVADMHAAPGVRRATWIAAVLAVAAGISALAIRELRRH